VTSALYPVWSFCPPDCPQMAASVGVLERDYQRDGLLRRDDRTPQSRLEGAFLPATFWMAQYWSVRNDPERARYYIEAGLSHTNDVGVLPEEIAWQGGRALGNLPLGMAHASLLNAVLDLAECEERVRRSSAASGGQASRTMRDAATP
jgi:GH15 family glucan-1,4-alpha-glucosidase